MSTKLAEEIQRQLGEAVRRRWGITLLGVQVSKLQAWLLAKHPAEKPSGLATLVAGLDGNAARTVLDLVTVPETSFFRFAPQLRALQQRVLPTLALLAARAQRDLRLLSVGCCTGEEAWTLAMLCAELGILGRVQILGADLNPGYLETARRGVYGARSVAPLPPALRQAWTRTQPGGVAVHDDLRAHVSFACFNLTGNETPECPVASRSWDLILCRNVLIYFDQATIARVQQRFARWLSSDGCLALGHAERLDPSVNLQTELELGAYFHRKRDVPAPKRLSGSSPLLPEPRVKKRETPRRAQASTAVAAPPPPPPVGCPPRPDASDIAVDHFVAGLQAMTAPQVALEHFRKVLYLDPEHLLARLYRARCHQALGRIKEARADYAALLGKCRALPADQVSSASPEITCAHLMGFCEQALRGLH